MNKKLKYILEEIKKAEEMIQEVYNYLDYYKIGGNNKYLDITNGVIIEIEEILSNLDISLEIELEENKDE